MGTADRTRQVLSAYRSAVVVGLVGASLTVTAGVTEDRSPPPKPPRVVSDGHTITPPPVTVTTTETATVTATPTPRLTEMPGPSMLPSSLPSQLPSSVPSAIATPTPIPTAAPTVTPSPTLTPRNHANGLKPPVCIIAIDHHGQVIKRPCKETP